MSRVPGFRCQVSGLTILVLAFVVALVIESFRQDFLDPLSKGAIPSCQRMNRHG